MSVRAIGQWECDQAGHSRDHPVFVFAFVFACSLAGDLVQIDAVHDNA
jgi:hypothetical protein